MAEDHTLAVMTSSDDERWGTPIPFFSMLNAEFAFLFDAAALANSALLPDWYGPDHQDPGRRNAFRTNWVADALDIGERAGRVCTDPPAAVWLNPPYGRGLGRWVELAARWSERGLVVVMLIFARVETKWWKRYIAGIDDNGVWRPEFGGADEIRFVDSRIAFRDPTNQGRDAGAPAPSAVIVFRPRRGPPVPPRYVYQSQEPTSVVRQRALASLLDEEDP